MAAGTHGPGARRKKPRKGAPAGSGGKHRRSLAGKGPTPKAEDREYHVAYKRKQAAIAKAGGRPGAAKKRPSVDGAEIVMGRNPVLEVLRAGGSPIGIYLQPGLDSDDRVAEVLRLAAERSIRLFEAGKRDLDDMTDCGAHQGIAMALNEYEYAEIDDLLDVAFERDEKPLLVMCDHITDPHNLGAIIRSATSFGAHGIIIPNRRSAKVNATVWKTSAGTLAQAKVAHVTNLVRTIEDLKTSGLFAVGLDAGGDTALPGLTFAPDPLLLVVGSEGEGLSRLVRENCDAITSIPMPGSTESLNASVAAGVALYEIARTRAEQDTAQ